MTTPEEVPTDPVWHTLAAEDTERTLATSVVTGLPLAEIDARRARFGPNTLPAAPGRPLWRMIVDPFTEFTVLVLIGAAIVSGALGELADAVVIAAIVVLNGVLGFVQEYRAERALAALAALSAPAATVVRGGNVARLPAVALVPGDLVLLEAGNVVPADLRVVNGAQLRIDEATLTGESVPVDKIVGALGDAALPVPDRRNMAFDGTRVTHGRGAGVVVATGLRTELGRIAAMLHTPSQDTPLQRRLATFGRRLGLGVLGLCAVLFAAGVVRGEPPLLMFLTALSLAVAAIPEALPAVVTVCLAVGARRMAAAHALVRRLPAVETLGSVTWVCADKTGTLTENRMRVQVLVAPAGEEHLLEAIAACNDARLGTDGAVTGDPTEVALLERAIAGGVAPRGPRVGEVPFSSERARMSTLHAGDDGHVMFTKGAPERLLPLCTGEAGAPFDLGSWLTEAHRLAEAGLRVLAVARRPFGTETPTAHEDLERGLEFLGLVGLLDPPRDGVAEAVRTCRTAGVHVAMITGDHPQTALAVARAIGIVTDEDAHAVLTGAELSALTDVQLAERLDEVRVVARVAPEQKIRIVTALQAHGAFVAMTGDGVNDAPALHAADIGVAMGRGGTDVAREAAHMVLLDDNFATIVAAVREGRRIYDNIRKFVRYALSGNSGEIVALVAAPLLGLPIPLLPIHILWVNLVTDGLPGLALTVEPAERAVMERPPRPPTESVFAHGLGVHAVWVGLLIGSVTIGVQAWGVATGAHWQSMAFTTLTFAQMAHVLAIRSERDSFVTRGLFTNPALLGAVALTVALQLATLYVAPLRELFRTEALDAVELGVCMAAAGTVFVAVELEKVLVRAHLYTP